MNRSTVANRWNLDLLEENYQRWRNDPASVDETWRIFFEGYELGQSAGDGVPRTDVDQDAARAQAAVTRLIDAYREIGHYLADLDPLKLNPPRESHELLEPGGLRPHRGRPRPGLLQHAHRPAPRHAPRPDRASLRETYCRTIGVEYMHIRNPAGPRLAPGADGADPEPAQLRPAARSGGSSSSSTRPSCSRRSCTRTTSARSGSRSKGARC